MFTVMDDGELFAVVDLAKIMLTQFVDNWDMNEHIDTTTSQCE